MKKLNRLFAVVCISVACGCATLMARAGGYEAPIVRNFVGVSTTITNLSKRVVLDAVIAIADAEMGGFVSGTNRIWISNGGDEFLILDAYGTNTVQTMNVEYLWEKAGTLRLQLCGSATATNRVEIYPKSE